jgi:ABC-type Mn2+/Zn2+ transport system ATPase subunit
MIIIMLNLKINQSVLNKDISWCVDIQLAPSVCHHFMGPNGLGKSSFLNEVKIQWNQKELLLGFVDQESFSPLQDLTVEKVVTLLWSVVPERVIALDWREIDFWKDVSHQWKKNISTLSSGENQWLKILMMRSLKSDVWMLDEPFQSLDANRQKMLWEILQNWIDDGRYLIVVHHGECTLPRVKTWSAQCSAEGLSWN